MNTWPFDCSLFKLFNFQTCHYGLLSSEYTYMLALAHSIWHHAGPGQIASVPRWINEHLPPVVRTEEQFLFVCHLVGPFLQRFNNHIIINLTSSLYDLLAQVDQSIQEYKYIDAICDLLYHIKYMFVGDAMKQDLEKIIRGLRPQLQKRLRFIAHVNVDESTANTGAPVPVGNPS